MREAPVVVLADKSLFDVALRTTLGLKLIDSVSYGLGELITTSTIIDLFHARIERLKAPDDALWNHRIDQMRTSYYQLLSKSPEKLEDVQTEIRLIAEDISNYITPWNTKVDNSEIELMAAAIWLRRHSDVEPVLVSDDRDVLRACHIMSSFFGLVTSVLSSFELLRLASDSSLVDGLCNHFSMVSPTCHYEQRFQIPGKLADLVVEVDRFARKGLLSIHPVLPSNHSSVHMTRKS